MQSYGWIFIGALSAVASTTATSAQPPQHVRWTLARAGTRPSHTGAAAATGPTTLTLTAEIDSGWHMFSLSQSGVGPLPLRISIGGDSAIALDGPISGPKPETIPTSSFGIPVEWYSGSVRFAVPVRLQGASGARRATLAVRFQACSNTFCLPPRTISLSTVLTSSN